MGDMIIWSLCLAFLVLLAYGSSTVATLFGWLGTGLLLLHLARTLRRWYKRSSLGSSAVSPSNKLVVITGCDSGFGLQSAKRLDYAGYHVLACCLDLRSAGARDLEQFASKRVKTLQLDVTKPADRARLVKTVEQLTGMQVPSDLSSLSTTEPPESAPGAGGGLAGANILEADFRRPIFGAADSELRLWSLVNNAGVALPGPFEMLDFDREVLATFEVNTFAPMRLTKALLPFLRAAKGRLVNVGSIVGRVTTPYVTAYSMSKTAVRIFTEAMHEELRPFGVRCSLVEPFAAKTPIFGKTKDAIARVFDRCPASLMKAYGGEQLREQMLFLFERIERTARIEPEGIVDAIEEAVCSFDPLEEYWSGHWRSRAILWLALQLPLRVQGLLFLLL